MEPKRLYKIKAEEKVAGVCAGVAEYLGVDVSIVRIIWLVLLFCAGFGLLAYIIAAIILPDKSELNV